MLRSRSGRFSVLWHLRWVFRMLSQYLAGVLDRPHSFDDLADCGTQSSDGFDVKHVVEDEVNHCGQLFLHRAHAVSQQGSRFRRGASGLARLSTATERFGVSSLAWMHALRAAVRSRISPSEARLAAVANAVTFSSPMRAETRSCSSPPLASSALRIGILAKHSPGPHGLVKLTGRADAEDLRKLALGGSVLEGLVGFQHFEVGSPLRARAGEEVLDAVYVEHERDGCAVRVETAGDSVLFTP